MPTWQRLMLPTVINEVENGVMYPVINEFITKYLKLVYDPLLYEAWIKVICKALGLLVHGYYDMNETNMIHLIMLEEISKIPHNCTIMYAGIEVDYRAQKLIPNCV